MGHTTAHATCAKCSRGPRPRRIRSTSPWPGCPRSVHSGWLRTFEDLAYRRIEWKSNALNAASRRAAERFGFSFEGVFRNHQVLKGRNRDTAWYAITDAEWPAIRDGFQAWLAPENFDGEGFHKRRLADLISAARA